MISTAAYLYTLVSDCLCLRKPGDELSDPQ